MISSRWLLVYFSLEVERLSFGYRWYILIIQISSSNHFLEFFFFRVVVFAYIFIWEWCRDGFWALDRVGVYYGCRRESLFLNLRTLKNRRCDILKFIFVLV